MKYLSTIFFIFLCFTSKGQETKPDSSIFNQAISYYDDSDYDKAKPLLYYSADSSSLSRLDKAIANLKLSRILGVYDSSLAEALVRGHESLNVFKEEKDNEWIAEGLYRVSSLNLRAGLYDSALSQTHQAFEKYTILKDSSRMIWSLLRRGLVFHDIGEYEEGIRVCNQAKKLAEVYSDADADLIAVVMGITAINYDDMGRSDKAVDIYREVLKLEDSLSSDREIVRSYNNLGNSLLKLGRLDESEEYLKLALEAEIRDNFHYGIATVKTNLGTIARKRGNYSKAHQLLDEAEEISFAISDIEKILDVLEQQNLLYDAEGKSAKALEYLRSYHHIKDSLYNLDKQRQIRLLETRFETNQKEQQLALQSADIKSKDLALQRNTILIGALILLAIFIIVLFLLLRRKEHSKQEAVLQEQKVRMREAQMKAVVDSQERERNRFAADLHDGMGQLIAALQLNIKSLENSTSKDKRDELYGNARNLLTNIHDEIRGIAFNLMPRTLVNEGLVSALKELVVKLNKSGDTSFSISTHDVPQLNDVVEISLYRIIQELLSNIIKHGNATTVQLTVTGHGEELNITIEDNGKGFEIERFKNSDGNGWRNINTRLNLISAEMELNTHPDRTNSSTLIIVPLKVTEREKAPRM